ncbi:hypothetical protein OMP38_12125 [Cohnella ginsengisoli]|uniref:ABC transporter substrate-binding protein n=1 Tax=Cohnella ginsengisoli TaxID=425004 RepID=A0A9X4KG06_9BACL|nr:hypothetical protein [Cohnella ginsengisoli]MDG0791534.1 hypothetical protein [Cohnella ginsengisoli]
MANRIRTTMLLMAALLSMGSAMTACSKSGGNEGQASASGSAATATSSATADASGSASASPAACTEPVELNMFVDATWYPFQEWSGEVPEAITKATCVKPKVTIATDDKQLALMVASGGSAGSGRLL